MTNSIFKILSFLIICTISRLAFSEEAVPGKQVLQKAELPASKSFWELNGIGNPGKPQPVDNEKKESINYWLFLPESYDAKDPKKAAPLLLFLHGVGERGNDPQKVKVHGPPKHLDNPEKAKSFPFVTVSPQCPDRKYWSPGQLLRLIDLIEKEYNIDKKRIYVTGLSMGGFGTWMLLEAAPERFAAAAPICGGGDFSNAKKYVNTPIWVFHGESDNTVSIDFSRKIVEAIKEAGGKKVKFTTYPNVGHDSWTETYNNPELYKFFLDNIRK